MKKLFYILILISCLFIHACDDDPESAVELSVIKSDVNMPALGGEGTIEVSTNNSVSATSSEEWCTVSVSGSIVTVTVPSNEDILSRTALVTISSSGQTVSVPVTQASAIFSVDTQNLLIPKAGGNAQLIVTANLSFEVSVEDDWLEYSVNDSMVTFTAAANTDALPRQATVTITCGKYSAQVFLNQISYSDLLGNWTLYYNDGTSATSRTITLSEDVTDASFIMGNLPGGYSATVLFDEGNLILESGQSLGMYYSTYYVYLCMWNGSTLTWDTSVQYEAPVNLSDGSFSYTFADNGSWTSYTVTGFLFYAFTSEPPSSSSAAGWLYKLNNLVMEKQ